MPTIKDVAALAEVSISTVSHFLNQTKYVSPDLQQRILSAMRDLNYARPNPIASSLRSKQTHSVGVIFNDLAGDQANLTLKGIADSLEKLGLTLMLRSSCHDEDYEAEHIEQLIGYQVDGLIIAPVGSHSLTLEKTLAGDLPLVLLNNAPEHWISMGASAVLFDVEEGCQQVLQHFYEQGHQRIALIGVQPENTLSGAFIRTYQHFAAEVGLEREPIYIEAQTPSYEGGAAAVDELLKLPTIPTALFILESSLTAGVLNGLYTAGRRYPQDVSVAAFGRLDWAERLVPPLTTLSGDPYQLGCLAVSALESKLSVDHASVGRLVRLPTLLTLRNSVAKLEEVR